MYKSWSLEEQRRLPEPLWIPCYMMILSKSLRGCWQSHRLRYSQACLFGEKVFMMQKTITDKSTTEAKSSASHEASDQATWPNIRWEMAKTNICTEEAERNVYQQRETKAVSLAFRSSKNGTTHLAECTLRGFVKQNFVTGLSGGGETCELSQLGTS